MEERVKIKVHPEDTVSFPGVCAHCLKPAVTGMKLTRKNGQSIREIEVPLCAECAALLQRSSGDEERLGKLRRVSTGLAGAALALIFLLLLPPNTGFWTRLILALLLGGAAAGMVFLLFKPLIARAASPEKRAVRQAAQLEDFTSRSATFVFANETFAERFKEQNESLLMNG